MGSDSDEWNVLFLHTYVNRNYHNKEEYNLSTTVLQCGYLNLPNTTLFVGHLDSFVIVKLLVQELISHLGDSIHFTILVGKCCRFVQFRKKACAKVYLQKL